MPSTNINTAILVNKELQQQSVFLKKMRKESTSRPPVWFMRQAGRILPNYMKLREQYSFQELMDDPELAAEVTLMPVYDLGVDAAILFSDILVIPQSMGLQLDFTDKGPVFQNPLHKVTGNPVNAINATPDKLSYIYNVIDEIIKKRPENIPLIGFCGAPFTVFCYMVQGISTNHNFPEAIKYLYSRKSDSKKIIDAITELTIHYVEQQIEHQIDTFQLFETHGGLIPSELYKEMFIPSIKKILTAAKNKNVPTIYFPKDLGTGYNMIEEGLCDYLSIDWQTSLWDAKNLLPKSMGLQGNIDPRLLYAPVDKIEETLMKQYLPFGRENKNWIINLGHGFLPDIDHNKVKFVVDWVKKQEWNGNN